MATAAGSPLVQHQQPDSRAWNGDLTPEVNPALARITASPGEEGVEGVSLHWDYEVVGGVSGECEGVDL